MRRIFLISIGIVLGLVVVFAVIYRVGALQQAPANPSFKNSPPRLAGKVGDTLTTPEGVQVTLLAVEKHGTQWLFHLRVQNTQGLLVSIWNADTEHGFALYNKAMDTFVTAAIVPTQAYLATHPVLAKTLDGQASADGWIAFSILSPASYEPTLFYRFHTVHTLRCGSGATPEPVSKCQPAVLYSTVHWSF